MVTTTTPLAGHTKQTTGTNTKTATEWAKRMKCMNFNAGSCTIRMLVGTACTVSSHCGKNGWQGHARLFWARYMGPTVMNTLVCWVCVLRRKPSNTQTNTSSWHFWDFFDGVLTELRGARSFLTVFLPFFAERRSYASSNATKTSYWTSLSFKVPAFLLVRRRGVFLQHARN